MFPWEKQYFPSMLRYSSSLSYCYSTETDVHRFIAHRTVPNESRCCFANKLDDEVLDPRGRYNDDTLLIKVHLKSS